MNDYRDERMKIFPKSIDIGEYLRSSAVIDYMNESVSGLADTLFEKSGNNMDYIRRAYEYVRDRIPHSADIDAEEVPCTASEVLETGHGICFAKYSCLCLISRPGQEFSRLYSRGVIKQQEFSHLHRQ